MKLKKIARRLRVRAAELMAPAGVVQCDPRPSPAEFVFSEQMADVLHERAARAFIAAELIRIRLCADVLREVADQISPLPRKQRLRQAMKARKAAKKVAKKAAKQTSKQTASTPLGRAPFTNGSVTAPGAAAHG